MRIRSVLFNLIKKMFKAEIKGLCDSMKESHFRDLKIKYDRERMMMNYPINQPVIIRSNEPDDLLIGKVVGYEDFGKGQLFLVIEERGTGKQVTPLNNAPPYWTEARESALRKLTWDEQWNVMTQFYEIDKKHADYKNSEEYKNRTAVGDE